MLKPKKKITKRELKEDALITTYAKVTGWYEENRRTLNIALGALVALVVIVVVYLNNRSANNEKATAQLGQVFAYYDNAQYLVAIDGVPERNIAGLRSIVENYGGTDAGDLARFYLAGSLFQLGRYDEALEQYEDFGPDDPLLTVSRLAGIAACLEAKGDAGGAASSFEKAATRYAGDPSAAENLSNAARNYLRAGNRERALELYRKLKKDHPASTYARDVDRYIAQLSS